MNKKGFTLVELLIVISILAILSSVVVLVLNPAQILAEARDSQRLSDMSTLRSALSIYLSTVNSPSLGSEANCYVSLAMAANCGGRHPGRTTISNASRSINGTGWIPVDFRNVSGGSPIPVLPIDPRETATFFYSYSPATSTSFELNANMESIRYANGGGSDAEANDGGNDPDVFETGSAPDLGV